MKFKNNKLLLKYIAIAISVIVVMFILWNTYVFFQKFKEEERAKMELYATAVKEMVNNPNLNDDFNLVTKIYNNVDEIPSILTDKNGNILVFNNLDSIKALDENYLKFQLKLMKSQNKPIEIQQNNQFVYYRNSDLLYKLKYYPIALLLILGLFLSVVYLFFNSTKISEQNRLWTGMAKETAHQIGTPLSSLMGWTTILRTENVNQNYVDEIEKDVNRLSTITNRFSKIGSIPKLEMDNIVEVCKNTFNYLKSRSSKQVNFVFSTSDDNIQIKYNKELIGWVIENLVKNAIDAMQGKGQISLSLKKYKNGVKINVTDTGKGIVKSRLKTIFTSGYTTKKRGWGLGLSLSRRIIKDYHNGKIYVKNSEIDKGTTFEILLK